VLLLKNLTAPAWFRPGPNELGRNEFGQASGSDPIPTGFRPGGNRPEEAGMSDRPAQQMGGHGLGNSGEGKNVIWYTRERIARQYRLIK
jgi:hypothetical protein